MIGTLIRRRPYSCRLTTGARQPPMTTPKTWIIRAWLGNTYVATPTIVGLLRTLAADADIETDGPARDWGLRFLADPDDRADDAAVFWRPEDLAGGHSSDISARRHADDRDPARQMAG